jgi:hypothetical protein
MGVHASAPSVGPPTAPKGSHYLFIGLSKHGLYAFENTWTFTLPQACALGKIFGACGNAEKIFWDNRLKKMNLRYFHPTLSAAGAHEDKALLNA